MFTLKTRQSDEGISFPDVHALMKFFKNQIYKDLQYATQDNDWNAVAVFSKLFTSTKNHTFKNISAGSLGFKAMHKNMFPLEHMRWGFKHYKSIPSNFRILIEWVDNGEGVMEPKRTPWRAFWIKYADSKILTPEELRYKM